MEEILSSDGLIISLDVLLGSRMDFFDLRGLAEELKKHDLELFPKPPPPQETAEQLEDRIIAAVKDYVRPKLKRPKTFSLIEVAEYTHASGDFYVVRFTADGRKLRVGVEVDALEKISIIDKTKLPALLESSKPAAK